MKTLYGVNATFLCEFDFESEEWLKSVARNVKFSNKFPLQINV